MGGGDPEHDPDDGGVGGEGDVAAQRGLQVVEDHRPVDVATGAVGRWWGEGAGFGTFALTCGNLVVVGVHAVLLEVVAAGAVLGWCRQRRPVTSGSCGCSVQVSVGA